MLWHTILNHVHPIIATWEYFETTRVLNRLTIQFWGSISRSFGPFLANSIALDDSKDPIIGGMMLWYTTLNYLQPFTAIGDCLERKNCPLSSISDFHATFRPKYRLCSFLGGNSPKMHEINFFFRFFLFLLLSSKKNRQMHIWKIYPYTPYPY